MAVSKSGAQEMKEFLSDHIQHQKGVLEARTDHEVLTD